MTDNQNKVKTYRFKFSTEFLECLKDFSRIHRFDDTVSFKDNWEIWCKENKEIVDNEACILKQNGYNGNVLVKMYKSARYYFKTKSNIKKQPLKRRNYVGLDSEFREIMDNHIASICSRRELKPSDGFINFMDNPEYKEKIDNEILRLQSYKLNNDDIFNKIKKTYKNRYFIYQKKNN